MPRLSMAFLCPGRSISRFCLADKDPELSEAVSTALDLSNAYDQFKDLGEDELPDLNMDLYDNAHKEMERKCESP